jgi:hypothetical protein
MYARLTAARQFIVSQQGPVTDEGTYRFDVSGELLTDWQVCRKALEHLFFGTGVL